MTAADARRSKTLLDQIQGRAALGLIVVSVVTLASTVVAPHTRVNEALFWLLMFVGGMLLGIVWCQWALRPH